MISSNLEKSLRDAYNFANINKHEFVTLEHLLLALTDDKDALSVFKAFKMRASILSSGLLLAINDLSLQPFYRT